MSKRPIYPTLEQNKAYLKEHVGLDVSFDLLVKDMEIGTKKVFYFYVTGFMNDEVMTEIMARLSHLKREEVVPDTLKALLIEFIPHSQVEVVDDLDNMVIKVLSGQSALFIQGCSSVLIIDVKTFPVRSVEEPDLERVVRGSRDGFVETLLINVSLVRRRIRDPQLRLEMTRVGKRSQTDVCIAYIGDIADPSLIESVKRKLSGIDIDGLTLADKQLEELMIGKGWNPYPLVRYSERPDVVSTHLLEGHIILFVDTSPSVMILPTTFFHLLQHAEEYRQQAFIGSYLRWVRYFGIFASLFLLPVWYLMVAHPEMKPEGLEFIGPEKQANLPIIIQFLLAEIGIDLMRMAAVHTPTPLATAMGLVAAILIGDVAVKTGLFVNEVIMYIAVATVGMFATPSYELSLANRVTRLLLLVLTAAFGVPGFVIGSTAVMLLLIVQRSYNAPYMWPFIPFNAKALATILVRKPFGQTRVRPSLNKPIDSTRKGK
jgi:stage V sporulation protein AF